MIEIRNLTKKYGSIVAAGDVSFVARNGEVTGLLGPNGAGKTTVLRSVGGLLRPDSGVASVDGIDARTGALEARARLGVLPETVGLYAHLTVREHLTYAGRLFAIAHEALRDRVTGLLDQFGLAPIADRRAGTLSLGQRRRVALARILVHDPQNVVLDEPTSGLDVPAAREVRRETRRLARSGRAVVFSSHVMPEVAEVCDRVVVLAHGRVVAEGPPGTILSLAGQPTLEDAFVHLIGSAEGLNQ
jgi:sodium transport system ATP-binding protein